MTTIILESYLFEEDIDLRSISCSADKLTKELKELIEICCSYLLYT